MPTALSDASAAPAMSDLQLVRVLCAAPELNQHDKVRRLLCRLLRPDNGPRARAERGAG
jgi:hypothetical protein